MINLKYVYLNSIDVTENNQSEMLAGCQAVLELMTPHPFSGIDCEVISLGLVISPSIGCQMVWTEVAIGLTLIMI